MGSWAGSEEFGLFLALYDALVARFGVAADERFAAVLNGITRERQRRRRQEYNASYRARPKDDAVVAAARAARAAYMRDYRARPRTEEEVAADRARKAAYMKRYRATKTGVVTGLQPLYSSFSRPAKPLKPSWLPRKRNSS
jgi:hypothetical protein